MSAGWSRPLARRWRQVALGLVIGAIALGLALWGVDVADIGAAFGQASLPWLIPVALIFLVQQTLRAWRQTVLVQAVIPDHRFRDSLSILCISFFLINTLPARIGEISRPLLLLERDGLPLGSGLALVFVERAIDLTAMFVMIGLVAWFVPVPSHVLMVGDTAIDWVDLGRRVAMVGVPIVLLGLLSLLVGGRPLLRRLHALHDLLGPGPARLLGVVLRLGDGFVEGMNALRSPRRLFAIVALTVGSWAATGWLYPALARGFGIGELIGYGEGIGVLSITMLGMTVPSAPGFAGTYEAFVRGGLALFGVSGERATGPSLDAVAVAYTLTMHWWIFAVQSATALYFLVVDRVDLKRLATQLGDETGLRTPPESLHRKP